MFIFLCIIANLRDQGCRPANAGSPDKCVGGHLYIETSGDPPPNRIFGTAQDFMVTDIPAAFIKHDSSISIYNRNVGNSYISRLSGQDNKHSKPPHLDAGTILTYISNRATTIGECVMSAIETAKSERINLRLQQSAKHLLERAAGFEGKSVSNFILSSALAQAKKTVCDHGEMELDAQASAKFMNALSKPVAFNDELLSALSEHGERVHSK